MVNFLLITHGEFGAYLLEAAEGIVGRQDEGVRAISISSRLSVEDIRRIASKVLQEVYDPEHGLIVVTDMPGGTPMNVMLPLVKNLSNVSILSGLNLYMIISGINRRSTGGREEIAAVMLRNATRSIQDVGEKILSHAQPVRAH